MKSYYPNCRLVEEHEVLELVVRVHSQLFFAQHVDVVVDSFVHSVVRFLALSDPISWLVHHATLVCVSNLEKCK